jgi:O-antigen ligase
MANRLNTAAFVLIYGIAMLAILAYGTVHQPTISLFYVLCAAAGLLFLGSGLASGKLEVPRSRLLLPLPMLAAYGLLQVLPFGSTSDPGVGEIAPTISYEPFATKATALHIVFLSIFAVTAFSCINSAKRLRGLAAALTIFGFVYAFYAILQSVLSPDKIYGIYDPQAGTPFGSFVNKHDYAAVIELVAALPIGLLFSGSLRQDKRFLYLVAVGLMGTSLILSGSRGGLVAFVSQIILLVILSSRAKGPKSLALKAALSIVLVVAAIGGAVFVGGDTSLTRISETAASGDVTSNRTQIWATTLKILRDNWPLGVGIGAFPQAYTRYDPTGGFERVEQAHNDYLQLAADAGVAGMAIGALFIFGFVNAGRKGISVENGYRRGIALGALAGCFGVLVHSLFDFVLHITAVSVMFSLILACLVAAGREFSDDEEDLDPGRGRRRKKRSDNVAKLGARTALD